MIKKVKMEDVRKIVDGVVSEINLINVVTEPTACIEAMVGDDKIVIEFEKRISYEEMAEMALNIAENVTPEDDLSFDFNPYIKECAEAVCMVKYYTDIDAVDGEDDVKLLDTFIHETACGQALMTAIIENTRFAEIINNAEELIEYRKAMAINTQAQRVNALIKQATEFIEQMSAVADTLKSINEAYADMDDETNKRLVDSVIKLSEMDKEDLAANIYRQMLEGTDNKEEAEDNAE